MIDNNYSPVLPSCSLSPKVLYIIFPKQKQPWECHTFMSSQSQKDRKEKPYRKKIAKRNFGEENRREWSCKQRDDKRSKGQSEKIYKIEK